MLFELTTVVADDSVTFCLILTGEVDWLLQMHQGNVSLFGLSVVVRMHDDAIDSPGLNIWRVRATLSVETKNGQPRLEVNVFSRQ